MSRLFCWVGWHAWYPSLYYQVKGHRWGVKRCRYCGERRELAVEMAA